ncbi:hypothetical protein [Saccharopolyspora shandongensis]|uniref:hypothetical protein n=1 Tax=Saccharopolyspora shandongensis TaxID=418495 RepID=UPI0033FE0167
MREVAIQAKGDFCTSELWIEVEVLASELCGAVAGDDAVDLDHGGWRKKAGAGQRWRSGRRSGWACSTHHQLLEVRVGQAGGDGLEVVAVRRT